MTPQRVTLIALGVADLAAAPVWEVAMNPFWPLAADGSLTLPEA